MLVCLSSWRDQPVPHKRTNDGFWLPFKDETFVEVKMYGRKVFTVDHQNYVMNPESPVRVETGDVGDRSSDFIDRRGL
jgi:hypothetical protein